MYDVTVTITVTAETADDAHDRIQDAIEAAFQQDCRAHSHYTGIAIIRGWTDPGAVPIGDDALTAHHVQILESATEPDGAPF